MARDVPFHVRVEYENHDPLLSSMNLKHPTKQDDTYINRIQPFIGGCLLGSVIGIILAFVIYGLGVASNQIGHSWAAFSLIYIMGLFACFFSMSFCFITRWSDVDKSWVRSFCCGLFPATIIATVITHVSLIISEFGFYESWLYAEGIRCNQWLDMIMLINRTTATNNDEMTWYILLIVLIDILVLDLYSTISFHYWWIDLINNADQCW